MKQKFTLNIADIQISVIADAVPDEVEHIRGLLDRKMREIYLKSRCPKTEAALLCAMDFAADRMNLQAQISELDERCEKYALVLDSLKQRTSDQAAELERLRSENEVLRSLLAKDAGEPVAPDPISPAAFFAEAESAVTYTTGKGVSPASKYFILSETPKTAVGVPRRISSAYKAYSSPICSNVKKLRFINSTLTPFLHTTAKQIRCSGNWSSKLATQKKLTNS